MFHLALTGGIAAGKTVVCNILEILGGVVYYSDIRARKLMESDHALRNTLIDYFGDSLYIDGCLNKTFLRDKILNDKAAQAFVDSVVHPVVLNDYFSWRDTCEARFSVIETALLPRLNITYEFNSVLVVTAPDELRLHRIMARDACSESEAKAKLAAQPDQQVYCQLAHYVIINDGDRFVSTQVIGILKKLNIV